MASRRRSKPWRPGTRRSSCRRSSSPRSAASWRWCRRGRAPRSTASRRPASPSSTASALLRGRRSSPAGARPGSMRPRRRTCRAGATPTFSTVFSSTSPSPARSRPPSGRRSRGALAPVLAPLLAAPLAFQHLCLFGEAQDGLFHALARYPLSAAAEGRCSVAAIGGSGLERVKGIEPSSLAWEARALPLSYTRARLWLCPRGGGVKGAPGAQPGPSAMPASRARARRKGRPTSMTSSGCSATGRQTARPPAMSAWTWFMLSSVSGPE